MTLAEDLQTKSTLVEAEFKGFTSEAVQVVETLEATVKDLQLRHTAKRVIKWGMTYGNNSPLDPMRPKVGDSNVSRRFRAGNEEAFLRALAQIKADASAGCKFTVISFKADVSWSLMAKGDRDTFLESMKNRLENAAQTFNILVYVTFNHEPENDAGINDLRRDDWRNMHAHLADMLKSTNVRYGVILMGYHSMPTVASANGRWLLENCVPDNVDFVFFDYYEKRGRNNNKGEEELSHIDWGTVFKVLKDFCEPRGMEYGLAETGICKRGFVALPNWFDQVFYAMVFYGASVFAYFNTKTEDRQPDPDTQWLMDSARETAFKKTLERVHTYNASL